MNFTKPPLPLPEQLKKWLERGLVIPDAQRALHYLQFIGYYRFSAYTLPFQQSGHPDKHFKTGTSFEDILSLYVFDRELRLLVIDAIERIEVALRSSLVNHMCISHGAHWFLDPRHFRPSAAASGRSPVGFDHSKFLEQIKKELGISNNALTPPRPHNEVFINHYFLKYTSPALPPAWMVFELLSFGTLSSVFANLKDVKDRTSIAKEFKIDEQVMSAWLHSLAYVRNICAHHGRLWNRQLVIKPLIANRHGRFVPKNDRFYVIAVILWDLLRTIAPDTQWNQKVAILLGNYPAVDRASMGFPPNWTTESFWALPSIPFSKIA